MAEADVTGSMLHAEVLETEPETASMHASLPTASGAVQTSSSRQPSRGERPLLNDCKQAQAPQSASQSVAKQSN